MLNYVRELVKQKGFRLVDESKINFLKDEDEDEVDVYGPFEKMVCPVGIGIWIQKYRRVYIKEEKKRAHADKLIDQYMMEALSEYCKVWMIHSDVPVTIRSEGDRKFSLFFSWDEHNSNNTKCLIDDAQKRTREACVAWNFVFEALQSKNKRAKVDDEDDDEDDE